MVKNGKFVVLLGGDAAGKSSVIAYLRQNGHQAIDWKAYATNPVTKIMYGWTAHYPTAEIREQMGWRTRAFDFALFYTSLYEHIVEPLIRQGNVVLFDSYFYKGLAKEIISMGTNSILEQTVALIPKADLVIWLQNSPETALMRKAGTFTAQEAFAPYDEQGFVQFQAELSAALETLLSPVEVVRIITDALTINEVGRQVADLLDLAAPAAHMPHS